MGLDSASVKFVCAAKSLGVDFRATLMLGRQSMLVKQAPLQRVFSVQGIDVDPDEFLKSHEYGEGFFSLFGAQEVDSMDYSSYENATIIHDMNSPVPEGLKQRFSVVYDGGTLEHVFNVPQALKNCMEMVQVGGHFLQVNIANNFMGHGFWQFSPELLFRVFSPENGFEMEALFLHEVAPDGGWYLVSDPDSVRQRVELCNTTPTYILTIARKVSEREVFANPPLQSDYSARWDRAVRKQSGSSCPGNLATDKPVGTGQAAQSQRQSSDPLRRGAQAPRRPFRAPEGASPFDRPYYKQIPEDDFLRGVFR